MAFQTDAGTIGLWRFDNKKWEMVAAIMSWNSDGGKDWENDIPPAFGIELIVSLNRDGSPLFKPGKKYHRLVAKRLNSATPPWPDQVKPDANVHQAIKALAKLLGTQDVTAYRVDTAYDYVTVPEQDATNAPPVAATTHTYDVYSANVAKPIHVGDLYLDADPSQNALSEKMVVTKLSGLSHRLPASLSDLVFYELGKGPKGEDFLDIGDWIRAYSCLTSGKLGALPFSKEWPEWKAQDTATQWLPHWYHNPANNGISTYAEFIGLVHNAKNQIEAKERQLTDPI